MPKRAIKTRLRAAQDDVCALSGVALAERPELTDTDRISPKADGGIYTDLNTRIVEPRAHQARHGTLRTRDEWLDALKSAFDDRVQMMKLLLKQNNQLLAYQRHVDTLNRETEAFLQAQMVPVENRLATIDKGLAKLLAESVDPLVIAALAVPGLGPITVAALTVYIDLAKASTASAMWKYVGLHAASHERYAKGQAGGGNKTLRTVLWNTANVMMKMRTSGYRAVYDLTKDRLAQSEKVTTSRNTQGQLVDIAWKDAKPSHRHGAALRAVMKHLLADYWMVGRTLADLPTRPLYAEEMLGHTHIVNPAARGWTF